MAKTSLSKGMLRKVRERGLCSTPRCMNNRRRDRHQCCTCEGKKNDALRPIYKAYRNLKAHAKERGIECSLTFDEFEHFYLQNEMLAHKGQHAGSRTVDRKDNRFGYHVWNIQPLTRAANTRKHAMFDCIRLSGGRNRHIVDSPQKRHGRETEEHQKIAA